MEPGDDGSPKNVNISSADVVSRNTSSPISIFDETFKEFVRKMSENAEFSTPEEKYASHSGNRGACSSSLNTNRDLSNSGASTSTEILSGAILTSRSASNVSAPQVPTSIASTLDTNIPVSGENIHILETTKPNPMFSDMSWADPSVLMNDNTDVEIIIGSPIVISDDEESEPASLPVQILPPVQSTLATENVKIISDAELALLFPDKTHLVSFTTEPSFILNEAAETTTNILGSFKSTTTFPTKLFPYKTVPISIESVPVITQIQRHKNPLASAKNNKASSTSVKAAQIPNTRMTTSVVPIPGTSKAQIAQAKIKLVPVEATPAPIPKKTATPRSRFRQGSLLAKAIASVPILDEPSPILEKSEPIHVENAPETPETIPVGRSSPISVVSKAAEILTSLAEIAAEAGKLGLSGSSSPTEVMETKDDDEDNDKSNDDNEETMEVEYLEEAFPRPARGRPGRPGRPRGSGKRSMSSVIPNYNTHKKMHASPQPSPKKRPGRPPKPFNFDKILTGVKAIKLPNLNWSANVKEISSTRKQVIFSRCLSANMPDYNPSKSDRVVKFKNSIKYSVRINKRKVKLLAAPPTVNNFKDIEILLKIVNDFQPHDPMIEYL